MKSPEKEKITYSNNVKNDGDGENQLSAGHPHSPSLPLNLTVATAASRQGQKAALRSTEIYQPMTLILPSGIVNGLPKDLKKQLWTIGHCTVKG